MRCTSRKSDKDNKAVPSVVPQKMEKSASRDHPVKSNKDKSDENSVDSEPYNDSKSLPLYKWHQVPYHLSENAYILTGYRMKYNTMMCLKSIFSLHNETLNIWTHLVGYFVFFGAIIALFVGLLIPSFFQNRNADNNEYLLGVPKADWMTLIIFGVYSFGCLMCTFCSASFHTFIGHENMTIYGWAHALDYFGITALVVGSFIPFCYFCFSCEPFWRWIYLFMISVFGVIGLLGPCFRQWTDKQFQKPKVLFYVCMVGTGIFPIIHIYNLLPGNAISPYVGGLLLMLSLYGVGVFVYAFKIPEFFFPGRFDIFLSSHQIWHVFVLAAAFVHFFNCTSMYINFSHMKTSC